MRAISIRPPFAEAIAAGRKRVEHRTRRIKTGPMLVLSEGAAVCTVNVVRVSGAPPAVRWHLADPERVKPLKARTYGWFVTIEDRRIRRA